MDGNWGFWSEWSSPPCPVTCGGSTINRERRRACDSPAPQDGGATCAGSDRESDSQACGTDPCRGRMLLTHNELVSIYVFSLISNKGTIVFNHMSKRNAG